jgi:alkylhydroperoxidase/carboxymuconolactone decarboxylase family protein YurZ
MMAAMADGFRVSPPLRRHVPRGTEEEASVRHEHEDLLRRLALNDEGAVWRVLGPAFDDIEVETLSARMQALVRLASLIALEAAEASYEWAVSTALAAGATDEEIVGTLVAVTPIVGLARMNAAALALGPALGLESLQAERDL